MLARAKFSCSSMFIMELIDFARVPARVGANALAKR